jgi:hypothetical protein
VATAFATQGSPAAQGPKLEVHDAIIQAPELYPTSPAHPDPAQVASGTLDLGPETAAPRRLVVSCTNCTPGSDEAQQFQDLVIEVKAPGEGKVYRGPLAGADGALLNSSSATVKVWLGDTGKPQAQGVTTEWSFSVEPAGATATAAALAPHKDTDADTDAGTPGG